MVLLFFQPELKIHAALRKKKICEVNNVFKKSFILKIIKKIAASFLSAGKPFSDNLEG